ncbi:hypothetical protein JHN49_31075 [Streptomyces sp. MBT57]|nr:hypothetical protein [Streptomyces sp. MBT57]
MTTYYNPSDWLVAVSNGNWDNALTQLQQEFPDYTWTHESIATFTLDLMPGYRGRGKSEAGIAEELHRTTSGSLSLGRCVDVMEQMRWAFLRSDGHRHEAALAMMHKGWLLQSEEQMDQWLLHLASHMGWGQYDVSSTTNEIQMFHNASNAASDLFHAVLVQQVGIRSLKDNLAEFFGEVDRQMAELSRAIEHEPLKPSVASQIARQKQTPRRRGVGVQQITKDDRDEIKEANRTYLKRVESGTSHDFSIYGIAPAFFILFDHARVSRLTLEKLNKATIAFKGEIQLEKAGSASKKLARMIRRGSLRSAAGIIYVHKVSSDEFAITKNLIEKFTGSEKEIVYVDINRL